MCYYQCTIYSLFGTHVKKKNQSDDLLYGKYVIDTKTECSGPCSFCEVGRYDAH